MHAPGPGIVSPSMQTAQLSAQFQSHKGGTPAPVLFNFVSILLFLDLLDQDSEMQRIMGATDNLDSASNDQE